VNIIGTRHGEKLYEALLSREERACAEDMGDYFRVPADGATSTTASSWTRAKPSSPRLTHGEDYNSHNTTRLDVDGMTQLLLKLEGMQRIARGETTTVEEC
jgi:UDP-N-acetylglucosamine 4,6-dehydratase